VEYADRAGLDGDMCQAFVHIMREMDSAYIKWAIAQIKASRARTAKPQKVGKHAGIQYRSRH
jgi:hypothetical protein